MTKKEELEQMAFDEGVLIDYVNFKSNRLTGLYINGSVALKSGMTDKKTADILAEELGHHYTTVGNILDQTSIEARKQEHAARLWAYQLRIPLIDLINAYKSHCRNTFEVAEYLDVSEDTLKEALKFYRQKYGIGVMVGNYYIRFEPHLNIFEYHKLLP